MSPIAMAAMIITRGTPDGTKNVITASATIKPSNRREYDVPIRSMT